VADVASGRVARVDSARIAVIDIHRRVEDSAGRRVAKILRTGVTVTDGYGHTRLALARLAHLLAIAHIHVVAITVIDASGCRQAVDRQWIRRHKGAHPVLALGCHARTGQPITIKIMTAL